MTTENKIVNVFYMKWRKNSFIILHISPAASVFTEENELRGGVSILIRNGKDFEYRMQAKI